MKPSKRIIYARVIFITGIVLLTSLTILFIYETRQESSSADVVYNTNVIRQSLERIFSALKERESAFRGYALTMDSSYRRPQSSLKLIHQELNRIDSLTASNSVQQQNLNRLKELFQYIVRKQDTVAAKLQDPEYFKSGLFYVDLRSATMRMDSVRTIIVSMQNIASELSEDHELDARKHTVIATLVGVAVGIFSIIVFIVAFYFIDQELKRSQNYVNEAETLNARINQINAELEQANRSLHKLNTELESKNIQLERYAMELSSFTHITSHDMQEPLRKIEFFISIVEEHEKENLSDEGKKSLEKVKQSVNRMRQLFLSMLDFSLTKAVDNTIEDVDLNGVLQQTLNSLKVYIKDTNTNIETCRLPVVKGIKYQLMQLFENILSNAIKFRRNDRIPEIQVTYEVIHTNSHILRGLKNDSKYYKIDFKDNGIGFDSKYAERIFDIFQRLLTKNDSHGVGMGLAICRKIAENHGGILVANSNPNNGSVFSLYIPVSN